MLAGDFSLFYNATGWTNIYNFMKPSDDNPYLGRFLSKAQIRKALHVGRTEFGDNQVFGHLVNDMMVCIIQSLFSQYYCNCTSVNYSIHKTQFFEIINLLIKDSFQTASFMLKLYKII